MHKVKLLPKQWEVFNPIPNVDYDIRLYQGGVGSGKTFLGALIGLRTMAQHPGCTWLAVADTWTRLKKTTWESYLELLDESKIKHKPNITDHIIRIPGWDARVLFSGVEDPLTLRSLNGIGAHLEEASMLSEAAYLEVMGRLRQNTHGDPIRMVLTTNPPPRKGWLYEHFVTNGGITESEIRGKTVKVNRERVIARTLDNPYVSDAFIAALQSSYDPEMFNIMVLGQDGDYTAGLVCKTWSIANIQPIEYRPDWRIYLTCDFNVDPMCWALAYRVNGEYHFFDEIVIENTNIIQTAEEFARRYRSHTSGIIITGDASGGARSDGTPEPNQTRYKLLAKTLSDNGVRNFSLDSPKANPLIESRIEVWNSFICDSQGTRRIKVDPKCKQLIRNCENLMYQPGVGVISQPSAKSIELDNKKKFERQDMFDAASYLVNRYDPRVENVIPSKSISRAVPFKA
jgi:hypothetical protein